MNENEMTDEQMEEATNPFAGMAVDGDESSKGITESEEQEMKDAVDTNDDGVVSEEELDVAINKLAGLEEDIVEELESDGSEVTITDVVYETEEESDVSSDPIADTTEELPQGVVLVELPEEMLEPAYPTSKSLSILFPPSHDEANMSHQQDWARACAKFSEENDCHFLGLSVKNGEPMFKEKK